MKLPKNILVDVRYRSYMGVKEVPLKELSLLSSIHIWHPWNTIGRLVGGTLSLQKTRESSGGGKPPSKTNNRS